MTEASKALFLFYVRDAGNWGGRPYLSGNRDFTRADRGNLTQLKKLGLVTTRRDDFDEYLEFTAEGKRVAFELTGIEIE